MTQTQETWYVEIGGKPIYSNLDDIIQRIKKGELLPQDLVKRGNLRWIEAQKVPLLLNHFNAVTMGLNHPIVQTTQTPVIPTAQTLVIQTDQVPFSPVTQVPNVQITEVPVIQVTQPPVVQTTQTPNISIPIPDAPLPQIQMPQTQDNLVSQNLPQTVARDGFEENIFSDPPKSDIKLCVVHSEKESAYHCQTCLNYFCYDCPKTIGGLYDCCPLCGAICKSINEIGEEADEAEQYSEDQDTENGETAEINDSNQSKRTPNFPTTSPGLTSDAPPQKGYVGLVLGVIIALALSVGGAYLWAYQYSQPDEEAEKKLIQVVMLIESFNAEKSNLILKYGTIDGKLRKETEEASSQSPDTSMTMQQAITQLQQKYDQKREGVIAAYREKQAFESFYKNSILIFLVMLLFIIGLRKYTS